MPIVLPKVPSKTVPWLLVILGSLGLFGLVGLMTQYHIWPFNQQAPAAAQAPVGMPRP